MNRKSSTRGPKAAGGAAPRGPGNTPKQGPKSTSANRPANAKPGGKAPRGPKRPPWMPEPAPARRDRGAAPAADPHAGREAARYEKPIASREMILQLLGRRRRPACRSRCWSSSSALTTTSASRRSATACARCCATASCCRTARGGFVPAQQVDLIPGIVIANPDGFGFLSPIPATATTCSCRRRRCARSLHGDRVLASVTGVDRRGRREGAHRRGARAPPQPPDRPLQGRAPASASWCPTTAASSATS